MRLAIAKYTSFRALCFACAVVSIVIFGEIDHLRFQQQGINSEYLLALEQTKQRLVSSNFELANDKSFLDHLQQMRGHGISQSLYVSLKAGVIDRIALFDADCKKIAAAAILEDGQEPTCRGETRLSWGYTQTPQLQLERKERIQNRDYIIVSSVSLGAKWLLQYPIVSQLFKNEQIYIDTFQAEQGTGQRNLLLLGGQDAKSFHASLFTKAPKSSMFAPFLRDPALGNPYLWPFFILIMISWLFDTVSAGKRKRIANEDRRNFFSWCECLSLKRPVICEQTPAFLGQESDFYIACQKATLNAFKAALDWQASLRKEQEILSTDLLQKELELKSLRQAMIDKTEHESLALQIKQTAIPFAQNLKALETTLSKVHDTLKGDIFLASTELSEQTKDWQNGIAQKGARKFLRSMYETINTGGGDRLTFEVNSLLARSRLIAERTGQVSLLAERIRPRVELYSKVLSHWYGMALKDDIESARDLDLKELIFIASEIARLNSVNLPIKSVDIPAERLELPMPVAVFTSAFYHVLMYIHEMGNDEVEQVALRKRQSRFYLNVRLRHFSASKSNFRSLHQDMAKWLLHTYDGDCQLIPAIHTFYVFSVSWPLECQNRGTESFDSPRVSLDH